MADKYKKLTQQFLCCYPVNKMDWSLLQLPMDLTEQKAVLDATCKHRLNRKYPVRWSYQEAFLKKLLLLLKDHEEVHDALFNALLVDEPETISPYAYKHYIVQPGVQIMLKESISFVSEGTTGLCTWEASLALADYLLEHRDLVKDKNILELGAGAGMLGIMLKQPLLDLGTRRVTMTDGSPSCVRLMRHNIRINFPNAKSNDDIEIPQCGQLLWETVEEFGCQYDDAINLLLAADVVYDNSQFDSLLKTFEFFYLKSNSKLHILLASTVRNIETLQKFTEQLELYNYQVTPCANVPTSSSHFCRDSTAAVQIISIKGRDQL
ncbi:protein-lysine N-methyltransferase EEF2KMT [Drosophila tropicalis]|uniref:protein-lysine N-methyltransferase EEF2KMT n=1 Tax=Drosophila tropicalis TaxID=46794 RepID=UPI0035AC0264